MVEEKRDVSSTEVFKTTSAVVKQTGLRTFTFVFSTPDVDRDKDVILQDGIDFKAYKKNPVILWAHDRRSPPVARTKKIFWRDRSLTGIVEFPDPGTNALSDQLHDLIAAKYLNAVSIGFIAVEWSYDEERGGYNFQKIELLEVSLVPVGSNRRALHQASAKGVSVDLVKDWARGVLDETEGEGEEGFHSPALPKDVVVQAHEGESVEIIPANEKEPEPTAAEPSGQESKEEIQQEPEEKSAGDGEQTKETPCQLEETPVSGLSYDEAVPEIRAATQAGIASEVKRYVNYWSGRLD